MRVFPYAAIAFSAALAVRLYPTFLSGLPFSTDAWSPIRNTEVILEHTPMGLESGMLDDYNRYWPANSLFGAVFSLVTGLKPMAAMAVGIPLAGAFTILIFYALTYRIGRSHVLAFFSSILLATAYPYSFFMAGVTKETYANPLYMLSILAFLMRGGWGWRLLFTFAAVALAMAHHLTVLVAIVVMINIALASSIIRVRRGLDLDRSYAVPVAIITAVTALYFGLYAYGGLRVAVTLDDLLSAASYQILALTIMLYLVSNLRVFLGCIASTAIVSLIAFLITVRSVAPDAPTLPSHYILYAAPFILASPLTVLGVEGFRRMGGEKHLAPLFWLSTLVGLEAYAVFGNQPLGFVLAYRALNFLCVPLAMLAAVGFHSMYESSSFSHGGRLLKAAAISGLAAMVALSSYNLYASVSLQERYMGYFWLYSIPEYGAAEWVKAAAGNQTVACDVKASYLLRDYFGLQTDTLHGLQYLAGKTVTKPQTLFTYDQMLRNGYVLYGGYSVNLPEKWVQKIFQLSLVYSNGAAAVHAG